MSGVDVLARFEPSAEAVAGMFWALDAEQQADFFAALDSLAGLKLCFQMAGVIQVIQERADKGDHSAMHGLQTMLSHAQGYAEGATDYRYWNAKRELKAIAAACKVQP